MSGSVRWRRPPSRLTAGATVVGIEQKLDDGTPTRFVAVAITEIPFYASWLAAPGAEVPVAVDPKNPAKAVGALLQRAVGALEAGVDERRLRISLPLRFSRRVARDTRPSDGACGV